VCRKLHTVNTAHALNVFLIPNLDRLICATNGNTTPATLFPAHIVPIDNP
jgi:hypothetical protein